MSSFFRPSTLAISSLLISSSVIAQQNTTTTLDDTIVTANRIAQSSSQYTGNIKVITGEQIQENAIQTLPEALDRLAGIAINANGGLGQLTSMYLRGHDSKRTLVLVDGMRFNDPTSPSGPNIQHLLVNDIERIEVIEGAQAGIWGADAAAGVINIITKKAAQGLHGHLSYARGNLGQKQTEAGISFANEQFDIRLGYTGLSSDEFSAQTPIINGHLKNPENYEKDGYENATLNATLGFNINPNHRLEVKAFRSDVSGYYDNNPDDALSKQSYLQRTLGANYQGKFDNWTVKLATSQGDISREIFNTDYSAKTMQHSFIAQRQDSLGSWDMGLDHSEQRVDTLSGTTFNKTQQQKGFFLARTQQFYLPNAEQPTTINLSLRNDDFNDYKSYIGKRFGVKQGFADDGYFAFNYADTRRMPSLEERYTQYDAGFNTVVREDVGNLHPETVESRDFTIAWKGLSITRFEDSVDELIAYDFMNSNYHNISGTSELKGWQWRYEANLSQLDSSISINYQILDAKDKDNKKLARRPESSGSIHWTYFGLPKTTLGVQAQYMGDRYEPDLKTNTGNYWLWHANINYQLNNHIRLFAKGVNLTDQRIAQANNFNGTYFAYTPRSVLAGIEYRF